ncbi:hypothetical protein ES705_40371 [subsurface metagenome]
MDVCNRSGLGALKVISENLDDIGRSGINTVADSDMDVHTVCGQIGQLEPLGRVALVPIGSDGCGQREC